MRSGCSALETHKGHYVTLTVWRLPTPEIRRADDRSPW